MHSAALRLSTVDDQINSQIMAMTTAMYSSNFVVSFIGNSFVLFLPAKHSYQPQHEYDG
jgi:hypothetical protein